MTPDDLLLLASFTRTEAGLDSAEAAALRPLFARELLVRVAEHPRVRFQVTQKGHARVSALVRRIINPTPEPWTVVQNDKDDGKPAIWSVTFGPGWRLSLVRKHVHYPGDWVASLHPLDEFCVLGSHDQKTADEAAAEAKEWAERILLGVVLGLRAVAPETP